MAPEPVSVIGERIRSQRRKLHMSLDDLGVRTQLSKSFLSQVERGTTSPSIESLSVIAKAIGVPMFLFFVEDDGHQVIRRRSDRRMLRVPDSNFDYESIWFGANRKMEIIVGHLKTGETSSEHPHSHSSANMTVVDECILVLQGRLEFQLGDEIFELEIGDSAYFAAHIPHCYRAISKEEVIVLFAIDPPAVAR